MRIPMTDSIMEPFIHYNWNVENCEGIESWTLLEDIRSGTIFVMRSGNDYGRLNPEMLPREKSDKRQHSLQLDNG